MAEIIASPAHRPTLNTEITRRAVMRATVPHCAAAWPASGSAVTDPAGRPGPRAARAIVVAVAGRAAAAIIDRERRSGGTERGDEGAPGQRPPRRRAIA